MFRVTLILLNLHTEQVFYRIYKGICARNKNTAYDMAQDIFNGVFDSRDVVVIGCKASDMRLGLNPVKLNLSA